MTEIRLKEMRICNFKGIRELNIVFDGKDTNVLGENGTGKTSIIDSFTWLLFGKDSLGRTDFGIKPTDSLGNIIHQLETSVEAIFEVSGTEKVFKKTLTEIWTRKRGAAEAEFTRNENNFYIDGVPKKKTEYTAAIKELIDEEVFKIITNPLYFNESVNWKDRRSTLLTICGEVSDADVIASNGELQALLPLLEGKSVSDFKEIASSKMKRINQELEMIPVRIAEAERAKPTEALIVDYSRKDAITKDLEELRTLRNNIENGEEIVHKKQDIRSLEIERDAVGKDFYPSKTSEAEVITKLELRQRELMIELKNKVYLHDRTAEKVGELKSTRVRYAEEWDKVFNERFTDSICPTCHRELPEDEVEARRKEFNVIKAKKLDEIEMKNEQIKSEIDELIKAMQEDAEKIESLEAEIEDMGASIIGAKEILNNLVSEKMLQFDKEKEAYNIKIADIKATIKQYEENNAGMVASVDSKIANLTSEQSKIDMAISSNALIDRQNKRIEELKSEQIHLATEYTKAEKHLYLAEKFIIAKVNMLNAKINQKFKYANFKLFEQQINGGINEVCEVTYNGIPYKDLNNAMRINIGLDVINTIATHYGVNCPIMIDNAESVNDIYHTAAQQIRFYVSKDKTLTFNTQEI